MESVRENDTEAVGRPPSLASKDASDNERREAARLMGSARTPAKVAAARRNALLGAATGGRPPKPLSTIPCTCGAGDALEGHTARCLRGQAIKRRQKAGKLL